MSKIRSMVVGLLVVVAAAGAAEAQAPQRDGAKDRQAGHRGMRGLLRGIALTDAEKANLKAVGDKYQGQFQAIRQSMRPDFEAARAARQRGDTAAARAAFARTADERAQLQALTDRMHVDARAALTAEHRTQFDANVARMKERMAKRGNGDGFGGRRGGRREGGKRARSA
jgi:Spy/CpxP family protein refolding chaperone